MPLLALFAVIVALAFALAFAGPVGRWLGSRIEPWRDQLRGRRHGAPPSHVDNVRARPYDWSGEDKGARRG